MSKPFAIVTGASSGIGLELATICAQEGFDLLIAADRPEIHTAAQRIREFEAEVTVVETDLATTEGVDQLWAAAAGKPVDALLANAGHGLGDAFLDQDFDDVRHVIDTNVTGTIYLVQLVGRDMRRRGQGRRRHDARGRRRRQRLEEQTAIGDREHYAGGNARGTTSEDGRARFRSEDQRLRRYGRWRGAQ